MDTRDQLLRHLWANRINAYVRDEGWIDKEIDLSASNPNGPFADIGPILARLLCLGATRRELSLFARAMEYNGVFDTLFAIEDMIRSTEFRGLHELVLSADPSGLEGRPGSAPQSDGY